MKHLPTVLAALAAVLCMATSALATPTATGPAKSSHGKTAFEEIAPAPRLLAAPPMLKNDIAIASEIITFGDLVKGLDERNARLPAFRAPALGETGTIQLQRIVESARLNRLPDFETGNVAQVVVTRVSRRINSGEIELALKKAIEERHGVDARSLALIFDAGAPSLSVEPEIIQQLMVQDLSYDQRMRRVSAVLVLPGSAATRLKPLRITGQFVETMEVVIPTRAITKGETLASSDVSLERRPRDGLGTDAIGDLQSAIGKVSRRAVMPGQPLRSSDVQRNEVITRGDIVTMVFEAPGLVVSMRAKANEAGAVGDVIAVQNLQSKRVLQAAIIGPGRVTANPAGANRVASAD